MKPVLSVLIVTWNCRQLINPCLDYLFASTLDEPFEVIVVDNQSHDGTADEVRRRSEPITVVEPGQNLGFGRGNNLAASHAQGDYLLLLNPDAYLTDPHALSRLFTALRAHEPDGWGAVAPRLDNPDGSHQVGDGGFAPTLGNIFRHLSFASRVVPGLRGLYLNRPALMRRERIEVDWLAATCLLMTRHAFETVGGFDPRFFMYGEDVDLGVRLGKAGFVLNMLPRVAVVHLQGATQRADPDAIHVSTSWIDAIFASRQGNGWRQSVDRWLIAGMMVAGFGARTVANRISGRRQRANAMMHYAKHGWAGRISASRTPR